MLKTKDSHGRDIYWYGSVRLEQDAGPGTGTDFHALSLSYGSVTPLSVKMTPYQSLDDMQQWIQQIQ
jgi:5'-nucleotidase